MPTRNHASALIAATLLLLAPIAAVAQVFTSELQRFRAETVTGGLEYPWGLAFLPDGRLLVTERPGRLRIVAADGRLDPRPVEGVPAVAAVGQGGLLDVALHPDFAKNRLVYLSYVGEGPGGYGTEVARGRLEGHALRDVQVIFRLELKTRSR